MVREHRVVTRPGEIIFSLKVIREKNCIYCGEDDGYVADGLGISRVKRNLHTKEALQTRNKTDPKILQYGECGIVISVHICLLLA
jgi:hypothetical protein